MKKFILILLILSFNLAHADLHTNLVESGILDSQEQPRPVASGFKISEGPVWNGEIFLFSGVLDDTLYKLDGGVVSEVLYPTNHANANVVNHLGNLVQARINGLVC